MTHWWESIPDPKKEPELQGQAIDIPGEDVAEHYGTKRHSGRWPYGSGDNPYQHEENFMATVREYRKQGLSDNDIAKSFGMNTSEYRHRISAATGALLAYNTGRAAKLKDKGLSTSAIGRVMGVNESTVRGWLANVEKVKTTSARANADILKEELKSHPFLDVGSGVEHNLGITSTKLGNALDILKKEGYTVETIRVDQGSTGKLTTVKVLAAPGTTQKDIWMNQTSIEIPKNYYSDDGQTIQKIMPVRSVDSKRVQVRYAEEGGTDRDGVIELRRGVNDISLGKANYAQVRIAVDGTHYLKGMAVYADDLPDGIDIRFNTNKPKGTPMLGDKSNSVLKPMKDDPANPFGASIKTDEKDLKMAQRYFEDEKGERQLSSINIVSEEGDWNKWSKTLASQFLSKQSPQLAKQQLDIKKKMVQSDLDDILAVTNPTVKQKLLNDFAEQCDSNAADLAAAALPRQASKVLLPAPSLKDGEIYAPHLKEGETVALVRYPHAGIFEIPILRVTHRNKEAKNIIGDNPIDAVCINSKTAAQLSGADFDGDTAIVLPIDNVKIKSSGYLPGLKDFSPTDARYSKYPGMHVMTDHEKGLEMGKVSNLITDMTIKGASPNEIERAVRHSMVVIDAKKHELNYKLSEELENIADLRMRYQKSGGGASTFLSRAGADVAINERREKSLSEIKKNPEELERWKRGELIFEETGKTKKIGKKQKDGTYKDEIVTRTQEVARIHSPEVKDAYDLVDNRNSRIERVYADYANYMMDMANKARAVARSTEAIRYEPSAAKVYALEVAELRNALRKAEQNSPRERKAQIVAKKMAAERIYNLGLKDDREKKKKIRAEELERARKRFGASKTSIYITDQQWKAISAGAVHKSFLERILQNADSERVKQLSTPRTKTGMTSAKVARAKSLLLKGYPQSEVATMLGVSVTTLVNNVDVASLR